MNNWRFLCKEKQFKGCHERAKTKTKDRKGEPCGGDSGNFNEKEIC